MENDFGGTKIKQKNISRAVLLSGKTALLVLLVRLFAVAKGKEVQENWER